MDSTIKNLRDVFHEMQKRVHPGWTNDEAISPQSLLTHSRRVRDASRELAAYYLSPRKAEICGMMAAVHDIVRGIVPDVASAPGITPMQESVLNLMAINHIAGFAPKGNRIRDLYLAYADQDTDSARFVSAVDRLDDAVEALNCERRGAPHSLQHHWDRARKALCNSPLVEELEKLEARRPSSAYEKPILTVLPRAPLSYLAVQLAVSQKIGRSEGRLHRLQH